MLQVPFFICSYLVLNIQVPFSTRQQAIHGTVLFTPDLLTPHDFRFRCAGNTYFSELPKNLSQSEDQKYPRLKTIWSDWIWYCGRNVDLRGRGKEPSEGTQSCQAGCWGRFGAELSKARWRRGGLGCKQIHIWQSCEECHQRRGRRGGTLGLHEMQAVKGLRRQFKTRSIELQLLWQVVLQELCKND